MAVPAKSGKDSSPPAVMPARMSIAEARRNIHHFEIEVGHEPEMLLHLSYWAHVARSLKEGDLIQAKAEDGSWWAEFLVQDAGNNWAKVACLRAHKLQGVTPESRATMMPGHSVTFGGTFVKWRVVRDVDQKVLRDKFPTQAAAYSWLAEYSRTVGPEGGIPTSKD